MTAAAPAEDTRRGCVMSEESSTSVPESPPAASAPGGSPPRRQLIIMITAAAALLVVVAVIIAVRAASQSQEYAALENPCAMVSPATLARYLPGASAGGPVLVGHASSPGVPHSGGCAWNASDGGLLVAVIIYPSATGQNGAQQGFDSVVQADRRPQNFCCGDTARVTGVQSVPGLGDQATAIYK